MRITRELKNSKWSYEDESQELYIETTDENKVVSFVILNRTQAFSLSRFLIRVFFRMSMKKNLKLPKRSKTTIHSE